MLADGVDALIGGWFAGGVRSLPGRRGYCTVGGGPAGGRRDRRCGRRAHLPAPDRHSISVPVLPGGFRLHGPGGLHYGPAAAALRPVRQGVYPHAHGLRLHRPGSHGSPHHGEREGPPHDHHAGSLYVLLRPAAGVRPAHRRLLPQYGGLVVFSLYLLGLLFAIGSGILLKKLVFQGEPAAFVLELPPTACPPSKISPSTCGRR